MLTVKPRVALNLFYSLTKIILDYFSERGEKTGVPRISHMLKTMLLVGCPIIPCGTGPIANVNEVPDVFYMISTQLYFGQLSVQAGDSTWHNEEFVCFLVA